MTSEGLFVLGLTGPVACGKSTVAAMTRDLGATEHIDADEVTHELMVPGTSVTRDVTLEFGSEIVDRDGAIDRRRLAAIVFWTSML